MWDKKSTYTEYNTIAKLTWMKSAIPFKNWQSAEKIEFEDERHIDLRMELVRQVDKVRSLIKDKYSLINQLKTKVQELEEYKHQKEDLCCKSMQDMDGIKVYMRILVAKFEISENHDTEKMKNLASEI